MCTKFESIEHAHAVFAWCQCADFFSRSIPPFSLLCNCNHFSSTGVDINCANSSFGSAASVTVEVPKAAADDRRWYDTASAASPTSNATLLPVAKAAERESPSARVCVSNSASAVYDADLPCHSFSRELETVTSEQHRIGPLLFASRHCVVPSPFPFAWMYPPEHCVLVHKKDESNPQPVAFPTPASMSACEHMRPPSFLHFRSASG